MELSVLSTNIERHVSQSVKRIKILSLELKWLLFNTCKFQNKMKMFRLLEQVYPQMVTFYVPVAHFLGKQQTF